MPLLSVPALTSTLVLGINYFVITVDNIAIDQKKTPYERCRKMEFAQLFVAG